MEYAPIQADRLRAVLAHIEAHPETWCQQEWHCGTTHCFAGHAQIMAGCEPSDYTARRDARRWLGLTDLEASTLFRATNELEDLRYYVEKFTSPKHVRTAFYDSHARYCNGMFDYSGLDNMNRTEEEVAALKGEEWLSPRNQKAFGTPGADA